MLFDICTAQDNGGDGFAIRSRNTSAVVQDVIYRDCVSLKNAGGAVYDGTTFFGDGFGIGSGSNSIGAIGGVICNGCIAQNNARDGIDLAGTVTLSKVINCYSFDNTGTGIASVAGVTNKILSNAAFDNGVADITGVTDLTLLSPQSFPGSLAGSSRWANAVS